MIIPLRNLRWLPLVLLAAIAVALYWPGLGGAFIFDDYPAIVNNSVLRLFDGSLMSLFEASTNGIASPLGRPLSMASFAANLHFFGEGAFSFKAANLLIHLVNGLLVYLLIRQLWPHLVGKGNAETGAFWTSALWLLHPINLTPVLFVVQRMTGLAGFFTLAALLLYIHGRQADGLFRWLSLGVALLLCWPAGVLAKETALLLPLFIFLCEWLVFRSFSTWPPRRILLGLALVALAALGMLAAAWPLVESSYRIRDFTLAERLLTEPRVLWLYVRQIAFPWPELYALHHDDISLSRGWLTPPETLVAIIGWLVAAGFAWPQRNSRPWLAFVLFWFLAGHALEAGPLGLEIAYEHRNYLPALGVCLGLVALLIPPEGHGQGRTVRFALLGCFVVWCGVLTGLRAAQWGDEYIRTQIEANAHPTSSRTHYEAAQAILARVMPTGLLGTEAYQMARIHFRRAADYDAHNKAALAGILYVDCAFGAKKDISVQQELRDRMQHMLFRLGDQSFVQGLGDMLANNALCLDEGEVVALIDAGLANPSARGKVAGMIHAAAMDYSTAVLKAPRQAYRHALAAVENDPSNPSLCINLIRVLLEIGDTAGARQQYALLQRLGIPPAERSAAADLARRLDD